MLMATVMVVERPQADGACLALQGTPQQGWGVIYEYMNILIY